MRQKINVNDVKEGDVIAFSRSDKLRKTDHQQYGVVVDVFRKDREVVDFRILRLTPYPKSQRVNNDQGNLMISGRSSIQEMGLTDQRNWRLKYEYHRVDNSPRSLGVSEQGKVTRTGQLDNRLYGTVFAHIEKTIGLPNLPKEFDTSGFGQGMVGNQRMAQLGEDSRGIEKKVQTEDRQRAHTQRTKKQKLADEVQKPKRKYRKRLPDNVTQLDISLEDAARLNLISKEIKQLLQDGSGEYAPKVETLRQAYELIDSRPEVIGSYLNPEKDIPYDRAYARGNIDIKDSDHITFSAIAETIASKRGLGKPLSWGQTAAFVELFPETFKTVSSETGARKSHFQAPMDKLIAAWKNESIQGTEDVLDLRETLIDIAEAWEDFKQSRLDTPKRFDGIQTMYPVRTL